MAYEKKGRNADRNKATGNRTKSERGSKERPAEKTSYGNRNNVKMKKNEPGNCALAKKCGGCYYQGIPYKEQLKKKQSYVKELLDAQCKVYPIVGMDDPFHYRNKVHAVFDRQKNGTIVSGVYQEGTHFVVPVDECQIEDQKADAIIRDIRGMLKSFKIKTYDEDTGYGLLRHVLIRRGFTSGEIMVVLVLGSPILPSKNNFVKALRKLHPEITTIIINVNNKRTSMILGEKESVIYGKGFIEDTLCGNVFRISSKSFYQVNPVQTEKLYNKAIELADLTGKERIVDAYCGIGTIGMIAAKHAKEVISVELNRDAVRDAVSNARRNGIKNITIYQKDASEFLVEMAEQKASADVVFMDPPRSGSTEVFIQSVAKLAPKKVVYISCNPETLARDLKEFAKQGYEAQGAYPYDMFPFTGHTECVVLLTKVQK